MPLHPAKTFFDDPDPPADPSTCAGTLAQAFANPWPTEGFLAEAEKAARACPGDPIILCQAATAALLDGRPDKAQLYLKRYAKRYAARKPYLPLVGAHSRGPEEADRCACDARAPRSDELAHGDGRVSRRLGTATLARREARRHYGSRASTPGAPVSGQARSCAGPARKLRCRPNPRSRRRRKRGRRISRRCLSWSGCRSTSRWSSNLT